jgi:hypothetical protein
VISARGGIGGDRGDNGHHGTIYVPGNLWNELWNLNYPLNGSVALVPGTYDINYLHITNDAVLECQGDIDDINEASGGEIGNPHGSGVVINSLGITVDAGAGISANHQGFGPEQGPGAGSVGGYGAAGSHGGQGGGTSPGPTYGLASEPTALGSGGGIRGYGGGAMKLNVSMGTVSVNGTVSADGKWGAHNESGGAGGSIWILADVLVGSGAIAANGQGGGDLGDGGGGGRIALRSRDAGGFVGTITVEGGTPGDRGYPGEAGTVMWVPW